MSATRAVTLRAVLVTRSTAKIIETPHHPDRHRQGSSPGAASLQDASRCFTHKLQLRQNASLRSAGGLSDLSWKARRRMPEMQGKGPPERRQRPLERLQMPALQRNGQGPL